MSGRISADLMIILVLDTGAALGRKWIQAAACSVFANTFAQDTIHENTFLQISHLT